MSKELVVLVDQDDNPIGTEEKMRAHELGLLHRAFSVFILNDANEILLQQRQQDKYHCGGLWANTCCSHPRVDEDVIAAGARRLVEEMGFTTELRSLGAFKYRAKFQNNLIEHEYDHVLFGRHNDLRINFNPQEVQAFRWISIDNLAVELREKPQLYTPWTEMAFNILQDNWTQVA